MGRDIHIHQWLGSEVNIMLHKLSSVYLANDKTLIVMKLSTKIEIKYPVVNTSF